MDFQRYIEQNEGEAAALLRALCAIPAPSHKEEKRAAFYKAWLEAHGAAAIRSRISAAPTRSSG